MTAPGSRRGARARETGLRSCRLPSAGCPNRGMSLEKRRGHCARRSGAVCPRWGRRGGGSAAAIPPSCVRPLVSVRRRSYATASVITSQERVKPCRGRPALSRTRSVAGAVYESRLAGIDLRCTRTRSIAEIELSHTPSRTRRVMPLPITSARWAAAMTRSSRWEATRSRGEVPSTPPSR